MSDPMASDIEESKSRIVTYQSEHDITDVTIVDKSLMSQEDANYATK